VSADASKTPLDHLRTGLHRRRLAALAEAAAAKEPDPVRAKEHLKIASTMRAGAKMAFAKGLRGLQFKDPAN
jgi:hypothetical protein